MKKEKEISLFDFAAPKASEPVSKEAKKSAPLPDWKDRLEEFELTVPTPDIKERLKDELVGEGLGKRDANKVLKGLFFKEKVFNTKKQAVAYLKTMPTTYAVKYKIGIAPSSKMLSLEKRLREKEKRLAEAEEKQKQTKFSTPFITCSHCHSKVNKDYIHPPVCPVCGKDMRSETAIHTEASLRKAIEDLSSRYENETERNNSHFSGGERWVVRVVNPFSEK